ncbi:energy-coupling factor transporter ATP-binding protein EcfA2 [Anaerotaenia torta]|uniref:kinase n=1 Tax=Anaerotaenia torta TaxID=433293 RepID=UPI003D19E8F1
MNREPKIIVLRGNSGSGKTTIAKELQRRFGHGTLLVSQDVVRREILYVKDGPETKAIDLLIELVKYGKENCATVILEGILYADWYQRLFEAVKEAFGSHIYAYYFDIPFEETLFRHGTKPNAGEFGEEEMKRWWREKDYLADISEFIIGKDIAADAIVNMIMRQTNG